MSFNSDSNSDERLLSIAIIALSGAAFGSGMSMRVMDPMLVQLASDFSITLSTASQVITVFGLAYGLFQLLFGPLGDRYGKYLVVAWGCIACSATALLCALAPDFYFLLTARSIAGATAASIIPLSMAWIGDVIPYEDRQPILAQFLIGQILGLSSGALIGGLCADYLTWRAPFFLISLFFVLIGSYLIRLNTRLPASARFLHKAQGGAVARLFSEFGKIFSLPWARVVLTIVLIEGAMVFGAMAFIASHLHMQKGMSLTSAGSLVMLFGLGGLLFAWQSRNLLRQFGESGLVQHGSTLMGLSLLAIAYGPSWWWSIPACFCLGLGFYMMHNTLQINATQMAPERRGAAVAAFASCFFLGQSAGVAVGASFLYVAGTSKLLAISGVGVVLTGLIFSRLRLKRNQIVST